MPRAKPYASAHIHPPPLTLVPIAQCFRSSSHTRPPSRAHPTLFPRRCAREFAPTR